MKYSRVFLLLVSIILLIAGCSLGQDNSKDSKDKNSSKKNTQIPKDWKLIDLDKFSFSLPKSMEDQKIEGIDSQVWEFEDSEMSLSIDSGDYTNDLKDGSDTSKEGQIKIDGKNVIFFIWDNNSERPDPKDATDKQPDSDSIKTLGEKPFKIGVYFPKVERRYPATNFVISTKTLEQRETAKKILYSIKFK